VHKVISAGYTSSIYGTEKNDIYRTPWTFPVTIRNVCKWWIEAERVVSRWTWITTQQFTTIFTNPGKKVQEYGSSLIFTSVSTVQI